MSCSRCRCPECRAERLNLRLRLWLAQREHKARIKEAHEWDADQLMREQMAEAE